MAAVLLCRTAGDALAQTPAVAGDIPAELLQTRVARPPGEVLRRMERFEWLAGHQSWDEACVVADELLVDATDGWVAVEPDRSIGVREAVHRRLAELPAAGLAALRGRIDGLADDWLRRGIEHRDERLLRQVVDRAFCSSGGDDALWALGEIALERGDYQAARAAWQRTYPETAGDESLAYPDASVGLADVQARLALVSIRDGDFSRAEREIAAFAARFADATGRLGGREVNYAARLGELLSQARARPNRSGAGGTWPTLQGNSQRTNVSSVAVPRAAEYEQTWSLAITPPSETLEIGELPGTYPVVADGFALFQDAAGIHAAPLVGDQETHTARRLHAASSSDLRSGGLTMTVDNHKAFAVVAGKAERNGKAPSSQLLALDLSRDGALVFRLSPEQEGAVFLGPPVVKGSRVLVGELATAQGMKASVLCYDLWAGTVVWRRSLGWTFDSSAWNSSLSANMAMAEDDGVAYISTNLGMIAALRVEDGEPLWLRTYPRSMPGGAAAGVISGSRPPNPCVVSRSQVIAAPDDSTEIIALDAATGVKQWSTPRPAPGTRILAVDDDKVLLSGERLWAISKAQGVLDEPWGGDPAGGAGQGVVAGDLVFGPTVGDILLVDRATGRSTGRTLPLPAAGGANLVVCKFDGDEFILAAGRDRLTAYRRTNAAAADATSAD